MRLVWRLADHQRASSRCKSPTCQSAAYEASSGDASSVHRRTFKPSCTQDGHVIDMVRDQTAVPRPQGCEGIIRILGLAPGCNDRGLADRVLADGILTDRELPDGSSLLHRLRMRQIRRKFDMCVPCRS